MLSHEKAKKLFKIITERKRSIKAGGGAASPRPVQKKQKRARIVKEEAVDPDMQISSGDGIGTASF